MTEEKIPIQFWREETTIERFYVEVTPAQLQRIRTHDDTIWDELWTAGEDNEPCHERCEEVTDCAPPHGIKVEGGEYEPLGPKESTRDENTDH
tara:strand:- start:493 stop:771 length:279 start_codon:yes stop_codon:yes gene_type:complete